MKQLDKLLWEYICVFPQYMPKGFSLKRSVEMRIDLKQEARPKMGLIYKLSRKELEQMKSQLEEALENGCVRPSISSWGSPVWVTPKKYGGLRMCFDYRALNKQTIKNQVPLPTIADVWDQIGGSKQFSTMDIRSGYKSNMIEGVVPRTSPMPPTTDRGGGGGAYIYC